jgi:hypothetical protein
MLNVVMVSDVAPLKLMLSANKLDCLSPPRILPESNIRSVKRAPLGLAPVLHKSIKASQGRTLWLIGSVLTGV